MGSLSRSIASRTCRSDGTKSRQFELARPRIVGALFDLVVDGLLTLPGIGRDRLPRMADFALWATACQTALWRAGTFHRPYTPNRPLAINGIINAHHVPLP